MKFVEGGKINWTDLTRISVKIHIPEKCHAKCTKIMGKFPNKSHIDTQNQHPTVAKL